MGQTKAVFSQSRGPSMLMPSDLCLREMPLLCVRANHSHVFKDIVSQRSHRFCPQRLTLTLFTISLSSERDFCLDNALPSFHLPPAAFTNPVLSLQGPTLHQCHLLEIFNTAHSSSQPSFLPTSHILLFFFRDAK